MSLMKKVLEQPKKHFEIIFFRKSLLPLRCSFTVNYSWQCYYYSGLILPLRSVLCRFRRDFYSSSRGFQVISVLLLLLQFLFINFLQIFLSFLFVILFYLFYYYYYFIFLFIFFISFSSAFLLRSFTTVVAKYCYTVNFYSQVNLVIISANIFILFFIFSLALCHIIYHSIFLALQSAHP